MGSLEKKVHLIDMSSLSLFFQAKYKILHEISTSKFKVPTSYSSSMIILTTPTLEMTSPKVLVVNFKK